MGSVANIIALITSSLSFAAQVAPALPHIVQDVEKFVGDVKSGISNVAKLDAKATADDVSSALSHLSDIMPQITQVIAAGKHVAI